MGRTSSSGSGTGWKATSTEKGVTFEQIRRQSGAAGRRVQSGRVARTKVVGKHTTSAKPPQGPPDCRRGSGDAESRTHLHLWPRLRNQICSIKVGRKRRMPSLQRSRSSSPSASPTAKRSLIDARGSAQTVKAASRKRKDGLWEARITFEDGSAKASTPRRARKHPANLQRHSVIAIVGVFARGDVRRWSQYSPLGLRHW